MSTQITTVKKLLEIERNLEEEIYKQISLKSGYKSTQVIIDISLNGELIEWNSQQIKEIHLKSLVPNVYRKPLHPRGDLVKLIFEADKIIYQPDEYIMGEETRTFNTYGEFLEYFTKKYHENTNCHTNDEDDVYLIWPVDKETGFTINTIIGVEKRIGLDFGQLYFLEKYRTIPEEIKTHIDQVLCPLTVKREDVCVDTDNIWTIFCHKENMAEKLKTNDFDEIIKKQFGKEA